jgi:hypothetical protein
MIQWQRFGDDSDSGAVYEALCKAEDCVEGFTQGEGSASVCYDPQVKVYRLGNDNKRSLPWLCCTFEFPTAHGYIGFVDVPRSSYLHWEAMMTPVVRPPVPLSWTLYANQASPAILSMLYCLMKY